MGVHKPFLITDRVKNLTLSVIITDSVEITDGGCTPLTLDYKFVDRQQ